jgi:hypothetical protein
MNKPKRVLVGLLSASLVVACVVAAGAGSDQAAVTVPVARNGKRPVAPAGTGPRFSLEPLWTIGGGNSPEQDFSDITAVAVGPAGEVFVLDGKECRILVFDAKGKFIRTFGRKGQGPGELSGPIGVVVSPGNEILVDDALNRRLSYFSRDGKPLRERSTAQGMGLGMAGFVLDPQGRMAARSLSFGGGKIGFEIKVYDKDLKPGLTLAKVELGTLGQKKFDPLSAMPGMVMAVDERGDIYIGSPAGYRINIFGFDGRPRRTIERDYDPVPVRKEDQDRIFKILGGVPTTGGLNLKEMVQVPAVYPAYAGFIVDPAGRILVRTFERGKAENEFFWDLFDAEGRYTARFASAAEFLSWRDGRVYAVQENEDGFKTLKCFRVIG